MNRDVKVLVIEDDSQVQRFLQVLLQGHGYQVDNATDATAGLAKLESFKPEVILLDLGLPDMDGLNMVSRIRESSSVPIVVISARDQENDKVRALDKGADDYLTKPFGSSELLARIRVALRHAERQDDARQLVFESEPLTIDLGQRLVWHHGELVHLTPIEFRLLELLVSHNGKVLTYRQILRDVWGGSHLEQNHYVRVHMAQLRRKLEDKPAQPRFLLTENGVGYRFRFQPDENRIV